MNFYKKHQKQNPWKKTFISVTYQLNLIQLNCKTDSAKDTGKKKKGNPQTGRKYLQNTCLYEK